MSDLVVIVEPPIEVLEVDSDITIELAATVEVVELDGVTSIEIAENLTILEVAEPALLEVTTTGTIGPEGPEGKSFEEVMLVNSEEKDIINDSPGTDDLTVYHGVAQTPNESTSSAAWLITRTIFLSVDDFDSSKKFAASSVAYDQVWDDHLTLSYA